MARRGARGIVPAMVAAAMLAASPAAHALSCSDPSPPAAALEESTLVFSGRVLDRSDPEDAAVIRSSAHSYGIVLEVERVWKGALGPTVTKYYEGAWRAGRKHGHPASTRLRGSCR